MWLWIPAETEKEDSQKWSWKDTNSWMSSLFIAFLRFILQGFRFELKEVYSKYVFQQWLKIISFNF